MIISYISRRILENILDDFPKVLKSECLNSRNKYHSCNRYSDMCSEKAIEFGALDSLKCVNCNLCSSACPVQCIEPSKHLIKKIDRAKSIKGEITIGCKYLEDIKADLFLHCILSLPIDMYFELAITNSIRFNTYKCIICDKSEKIEKFKSVLMDRSNNSLIKNRFKFNDKPPDKVGLSRRDFMDLVATGSKRTLDYVTGDSSDKKSEKLFYKKRLINELDYYDISDRNGFFEKKSILSSCWGCGLCVKKCPNEALEIKNTENGFYSIMHDEYKCVDCRTCSEVCPENSIISKADADGKNEFKFKKCSACENNMKKFDSHYFCYYCGRKESF